MLWRTTSVNVLGRSVRSLRRQTRPFGSTSASTSGRHLRTRTTLDSTLEYLLVRPDDSPLFDDGRARWWTFVVLDEAHQYRGTRGIEMAMLLRRLKQRLREGGSSGSFRCTATSATLAGGA